MVKQLVEMKRTFAVLVLAFLVTMATIDKTDYHSAIVFEKLGTILHNQGVVAMNTDDMLISVFVKVPLPKVHVHTSCTNQTCTWHKRCKYCHQTTHCKHSVSEQHWLNLRFERISNQYISLFNDISGHISTLTSHQKSPVRRKRLAGLIAGIGMGLFNFAFSGIETYKLNSKISEMRSDFDSFKSTVHALRTDLITLQDDTIQLFDSFAADINHKLIKLACTLEAEITALGHLQLLDHWESKLRQLFKYPLIGRVSGPLTPDIVSTPHLREILESHPELQSLIYTSNLANFYSTTTISMGEVTLSAGSLNIHYVLHVPSVKKDATFPLYKLSTVNLAANNSCWILDAPKYVYYQNDAFYKLPELDCEIGNMISFCHSTSTVMQQTEAFCLTDSHNCSFIEAACTKQHAYSAAGVLVAQAIDIYATLPTSEVVRYKLNEVKTRFIGWKNISTLQVDQLRFSSPIYAPLHLEMNDTTAVVSELLNVLEQQLDINTTFNAKKFFNSIAIDDEIIPNASSHILLFALTALVTIICVIAIAIACKRYGLGYELLKGKIFQQLSTVRYQVNVATVDETATSTPSTEDDMENAVILPRT